jgi:hypothetical protein
MVVTAIDAPVALWLAQAPPENPWIGLRLVSGSHDALGAEVEIDNGALRIRARVRIDGSYASSRDPRLLFGLGPIPSPPTVLVTVRWLSGRVEAFDSLSAGSYHTLSEGSGRVVEAHAERR